MNTIFISSSFSKYEITFYKKANELLSCHLTPSTVCIYDSFFESMVLSDHSMPIKCCESNKSLSTVEQVIKHLRSCGATRETSLFALGGGIIQDIATISASIYMRGISWIYAPSTLLGMVDSCIGGKSSINVDRYKNLIGNFYPPISIAICPELCQTLPKSDIAAGLLEALKICVCHSSTSLEEFSQIFSLWQLSAGQDLIEKIIHLSLSSKKLFVEEDERDKSIRQLLNFGHTFGHALEVSSQFMLPHGIAIGIGMLAAFNMVPSPLSTLVSDIIYSIINYAYASKIALSLSRHAFASAFSADKKHSQSSFNLILPSSDSCTSLLSRGGLSIVTFPRTASFMEDLQEILESVCIDLRVNTSLHLSFQ